MEAAGEGRGEGRGLGSGPGPGRRRGDVFVNMQTDFRAQLGRCQKLLLGPGAALRELRIHGLGLAIPRAINIALQLEAAGAGALTLAAATSTVPLPDGAPFGPDARTGPDGGAPPEPRAARHNSAIHIRVSRADGPAR